MGEGGEETHRTDVFVTWGLSSSVPRDLAWLTPSELDVYRALAVPKRAADWRLGRWIGKEAVRRALNAPALEGTAVEILASPGGAPSVTVLPHAGWPQVSLSLSHAWGMGFAAAVAGAVRIGCDVEALRPRSDAFVSDYFTVAEAKRVRQAPPDHRVEWANLLWSAKESALKMLGEGLRLDTRSVEVTVEEAASTESGGDGWRDFVVTLPGGETRTGRWQVASGFVWTLVTDVPVRGLHGAPVE